MLVRCIAGTGILLMKIQLRISRKSQMRTVEQFYRVDRRRISLIKFIFEAYEGLAVVSTLESAMGIISLRVAPGCEDVARAVILDLGKDFLVEPMAPGPATWRGADT
jgi:hypothetical protein